MLDKDKNVVNNWQVFKQEDGKDYDIRGWLPGENYQCKDSDHIDDCSYTIPAKSYEVNSNFTVTNIPNGTYTLALQIYNPKGKNGSALRFAIKNYFNVYGDEYHPIGKIGIGEAPDEAYQIGAFDIPQDVNNRKLSYN